MTGLRLPAPTGVELIDVELFGAKELSCSYLVHSSEPALIETGPATVFETLKRELDARGVEPKHVVLTHIHLDHGGGAGHVSELFPGATIWVHDVGAKHVVDPSRLVASARRLFGDMLDTLYGEPTPVPEGRIRAMGEGDVIPLGDRELHVLYTPGHARHEVTLFEPEGRTAFVGDTAGICYGDAWQKPATPPPEFDLEAALHSIQRVKGLGPETICFTHFGPTREPALDQAATDLRAWDDVLRPLVREGAELDELVSAVGAISGGAPPGDPEYSNAAATLSSDANSILGYVRYYQKQAEATASP